MKFKLEESVAYMSDRYVPFSQANLSIASSPVLYGLSVYTVFNIKYDASNSSLYVFRLRDHYNRLIDSAKIMDFQNFQTSWNYEKFEKMAVDLLLKNDVKEDSLIRASVFIDELSAGTRMHGLKNSLCAYVYPIGEVLNKSGINVCISSWQRTPDNSIPSRAKINGSYANASLMKNEALLNGYDEALSLDQSGHITEGTIANVFIVKNGVLITPEGTSDILEGITRSTVHNIADKLKIKYRLRSIDRSEIYTADEIFLCGSSANIVPVISVDKRIIGNGKCGIITKKISGIYEDIRSNKLSEFSGWLTAVKV
jgi:branched-chain amino acid aminotransferase